jgi:hypothetical protein
MAMCRQGFFELFVLFERNYTEVASGFFHKVATSWFAALREPHIGLAADSCCTISPSASRFEEHLLELF